MAAKAPAPADAAPAPTETADAPPVAPRASFLPALIAIVLGPALTWGVVQFVLLPRLVAEIGAATKEGDDAHAAVEPAKPAAKGGHGESAAAAEAVGYRIENVVVNLAGTMGTRYLKVSFLITGKDPKLTAKFDAARPQIGDVTLAVLSSLTLADLEEAGSKNIIRERLIDAYNQVFGTRVAEQLFFSDFVVQ